MGLRPEFTLHHSTVSEFLYAPIWEEENGSTLSVFSALARLGIAPWAEAVRLAELPRDAAVSELVATISRLPEHHRASPDLVAIADRLVSLLPKHAPSAPDSGESDKRHGMNAAWVWLIGLAVLAVLLAIETNGSMF